MNTKIILFLPIVFLFLQPSVINAEIIPTPLHLEQREGSFEFSVQTFLYTNSADSFLINYMNNYIKTKTGQSLILKENNHGNRIFLELLKEDNDLGAEGYVLDIHDKVIRIEANTSRGLFYGIQSLWQLMPNTFFSGRIDDLRSIKINCLRIMDKPKYSWRAFMLDSGRQYHTVDFIKKYIDLLALFKMNVFHWHLTENDGWRIEILHYPRLTEVGAFVGEESEQSGYYNRDEIREIVQYASERFIEVVPEIDIPGHSNAALVAYPELTCGNQSPVEVEGHSPYLYCGGDDFTYTFLENVLDEICELFPSKYVHLGGDEAPKSIWDTCNICQELIKRENLKNSEELQQYFSNHFATYLVKRGKIPVFWEDVLLLGDISLPQETVIQWWNYRKRGEAGMKIALEKNHRVIASTNYYTYLCFPEKPWKGFTENRTFSFRDAYLKNPSHIENPEPLLLGMTACLWSDYNLVQEMVDRRVFPRILPLAEQMWNSGKLRDFDSFLSIAEEKLGLLEALEVNHNPLIIE